MYCQNCGSPNADNTRFCAQCGKPMVQVAGTPPTPQPSAAKPPASGSNKTILVVLGVFLAIVLMVVVGVYAAFHMVASKVRALAGGDTQATAQTQDAPHGNTAAEAQVTGNVIGGLLGTDAKGKSEISSALANMQQVGQQIGQHEAASGPNGVPDAQDTQQAVGAVGGLLGALGHSLGGAHRHDPVDFHTLAAMLPASVSGMQRSAPRGEADQAMGIKTTSAEVDFSGDNDARITVHIGDGAAFSGLAGLAKLANAKETEEGDSYEKNETIAGQSVHVTWDAASRHGDLSLIVGNRFGVTVRGDNVDIDLLKATLAQIDLGKLESMKDANPSAQ